MAANLKIYNVGQQNEHSNWMRGNVTSSMDKADVVVFPGGADVNPAMYGQAVNVNTKFNAHLDAYELSEYLKAKEKGKKMVGICRGAQFLCVQAGGRLVQEQMNALQRHQIFTFDGSKIIVSSDHHQAMFPWELEKYEVLGWSFGVSLYHDNSKFGDEMVIGKVPLDMEVELAFFPTINALCIQSHPEWQFQTRASSHEDRATIEYMRDLMDRFMDGDKFEGSKNAYSV